MIYIVKSIIRLLSISFLIFTSLSSVLCVELSPRSLAQFPDDWETFKQKYPYMVPISQANPTFSAAVQTRYYFDLKKDNFKDYATRDRILYQYFHSIWNKILDANKELLSKFGEKDPENMAIIDWEIFNGTSTVTTALGGQLILFEIGNLFPIYINDAYIAAALSHELAHILLKHFDSGIAFVKKLGKKYINIHKNDKNINPMELKENVWVENGAKYQFVYSHPDFTEFNRKHEIEADSLGFVIYLNAGFKAKYYTDSFLLLNTFDRNPYLNLPLSPEINNGLYQKLLSTRFNLEINGLSPKSYGAFHQVESDTLRNFINDLNSEKKESLLEMIENNKYQNSTQEHPHSLWRFWNLAKQEEKKQLRNNPLMNNEMVNTAYFRIDLTKLKRLDEVRKFLSNKDNLLLNINQDVNDPRVYTIFEILNNDDISLNLELDPADQKDIGTIKDDNTMLLRANDLFRISAFLLKDKIVGFNNPCLVLFRYTGTVDTLEFSIKSAFM